MGSRVREPPFPPYFISLVNIPPTEYILEMVVVRVGSTFDCKSNTQLKMP